MKFDIRQKIYLMSNTGAIGDTVATFPFLKLLADRGQIEKMFIQKKLMPLHKLFFDDELLVDVQDHSVHIPKDKVPKDMPEHVIDKNTGDVRYLKYDIDTKLPVVYPNTNKHTSIRMDLVDNFSINLGDCILKETEKNYPSVDKAKLPKNPIESKNYVVLAYGAAVEHRRMLPEVFKQIKDYFLNQGIDVVLLGKSDFQTIAKNPYEKKDVLTVTSFEETDFSGCINYIDKTTLPEAISIIYDANMLIGVDNGLMHLAGLTETPVVGGYTLVDPYFRLPYRHNVKGWEFYLVEPDSECRYCQTDNFEVYGVNFLYCNSGTKECQNSLTADKWIKQIKKVKKK